MDGALGTRWPGVEQVKKQYARWLTVGRSASIGQDGFSGFSARQARLSINFLLRSAQRRYGHVPGVEMIVVVRALAALLFAALAAPVLAQDFRNDVYNFSGAEFESAAADCQKFCQVDRSYPAYRSGPTRRNPSNGCLKQTRCACVNASGNEPLGFAWTGAGCPTGYLVRYVRGRRACVSPAYANANPSALSIDPELCTAVDDSCPVEGTNPVSAATGSKFDTVVDFATGGAYPLELKRLFTNTSVSEGTLVKSLDSNWRFSFEMTFVRSSANRIFLTRPTDSTINSIGFRPARRSRPQKN